MPWDICLYFKDASCGNKIIHQSKIEIIFDAVSFSIP